LAARFMVIKSFRLAKPALVLPMRERTRFRQTVSNVAPATKG
jgi:hypothetical protein